MYEKRIMKAIKILKRRIRKNNRGSEIDQNTLHACMEISQ
jgi:hypothetical protein